MLKRIAVLALASVALSGCNTLAALGVSQATITAIQQAAVSVCGFLPTVETVAGIVSGGLSGVPSQVADAICKAVAANNAPTGGMMIDRKGTLSAPRAIPPGARVGATMVQGIFVR